MSSRACSAEIMPGGYVRGRGAQIGDHSADDRSGATRLDHALRQDGLEAIDAPALRRVIAGGGGTEE